MFSFVVLGLLVSGLVLAVFSQTPVFKSWLKNRIIAVAESHINGKIAIRNLKGTLFTDLQIEDLSVSLEDQTLLHFERASLQYSPLDLLTRKIHIRQVILEAPALNLSQEDSNIWNINRLLITAKSDSKEIKIQSQSDFNWEIAAPNIQILSGEIEINRKQAVQWQIPKKIKNLNVKVGFWMRNEQMNLSLGNLSFEASEPDLIVRSIRSDMKYDSGNFQASNFEIETGNSKFISSLDIKNFNDPEVIIVIKGQPISLAEVRRAVPLLKIYGTPRLDLELQGRLNNLHIFCNLRIGSSKIQLNGNLQVREQPYGYDIRGKTTNLNLAELTNQKYLASNINFQFHVKGQDLEWGKINSEISVDFDTCYALGKQLDPSRLHCYIKGDSVSFTSEAKIEGARAILSGDLVATESKFDYQLKANLQRLDLGRFLDTPGFSTNLNMDMLLDGTGLSYDFMAGNLSLKVSPSSIHQIPVESAYFNFTLENQIFSLHDFSIFSPLGHFSAEGDISIQKGNHLKLEADFKDFSVLSNAMPMDSLYGRGHFLGQFEGPLDSLKINADLALSQIGAKDLHIEQVNVECSGFYTEQNTFFKIEGQALAAQMLAVKNIDTDFKIDQKDSISNFDIQLRQGNGFLVDTQGKLTNEANGFWLYLHGLDIEYFDHKWKKSKDATLLNFTDNGIDVSGLQLSSEDQTFTLSGHFDYERENQLQLELTDLDISRYRIFFEQDGELDGRFSLELLFNGTMERPGFTGYIELVQGQYYQVAFDKIAGNFNFKDDAIYWQSILSKVKNDSLVESSGYLPFRLTLIPLEYELLADEQLEFKINARGLDLSFLQAFTKSVQNIKGILIADLLINNTLNDLNGVGPIRVFNGEFDITEFGTKYRNVNIAVIMNNKDLIIRDFRMRSGGGELKLIEGGLSLSEKNLTDFKARFKLNDFQFMNRRKMQAKVNGEIELTGSIQAPNFSGELTVNESRIYYPAWLEEETFVELTSRPFFIISPDSVEFDTTGAVRFHKSSAIVESDFTETQFYKNLRGELSVSFPRNTWIRGEDTNIEVTGELVAVKEGPELALFGPFSVMRGYYEVLGNRFQISSGDLVFKGEPEPNPEANIEAVYDFTDVNVDDPQKHKFKVFITGTLYSPEFKFMLDDKIADQGDVLSILVFGQSFADLTYGQKTDLSPGQEQGDSNDSGIESKATGFLAGQVLKRLSGQLGKTLRLDVIQIESEKNFEAARLRVGKYITPDVFVSISQDFGAEGNQKVELEYEIPRKILFFNLLLQASRERLGATGLDVIWKIEW